MRFVSSKSSLSSKEEIEEVARDHFANPGARIGQKKVAYEVTKDIHGEEAAKEAIAMTEALFKGDVRSLKENEVEEVFDTKYPLSAGVLLEDALIETKLATSKREARTFLSGNSVMLNGEKVTDPKLVLDKENALYGRYLILRRGKKNYALGVIE